jgi:hypothetical protein
MGKRNDNRLHLVILHIKQWFGRRKLQCYFPPPSLSALKAFTNQKLYIEIVDGFMTQAAVGLKRPIFPLYTQLAKTPGTQ